MTSDDDPGRRWPGTAEIRAEPVGSLLRPDYLLRAREARDRGRLTPAEFKRIEDRAVNEAVALQEEAGLRVLTDGEMRRTSFQAQMTAAVEGFGDPGLEAFLWGRWKGDDAVGDRTVKRPQGLAIRGRLRRRRSLSAEEFVYLRSRTSRLAKVTLPSPLLFLNFWPEDDPPDAYPDVDRFLEDVARVLREEVRELRRLGCRYVQIDAPHYPLLRDPETAGFYERFGRDREAWLRRSVELENAVMEAGRGADRPGDPGAHGRGERSAKAADGDGAGIPLTFGLHMCRGNQESRWLASGDYAPIAEVVFPRTRADRLLLEYDDARSGGFGPLAEVPRGTTAVLGIVTTKRSVREEPAELEERIRRASEHVPLDRLAVSPQCGFATSVVGNRISREDQVYKLRALVETARRVWPGC